jgi:hypothetical protein
MAETSELTKYLKDFLIQSIKQKKGVFRQFDVPPLHVAGIKNVLRLNTNF